jgi:hypothetical protein
MTIFTKAMHWLKDSTPGRLILVAAILLVGVSVSMAYSGAVRAEKNYSAIGTVVSVSPTSLSLSGKDGSLEFDPSTASKIQSKGYVALTLDAIEPGDEVIVQGIESTGGVIVKRIIDMTWTSDRDTDLATSTVATSTATSTVSSVATTTVTEGTSTSPTSPVSSTSTDSIATSTISATTTDAGATSNATSTATSTDTTASSTTSDTDTASSSTSASTSSDSSSSSDATSSDSADQGTTGN